MKTLLKVSVLVMSLSVLTSCVTTQPKFNYVSISEGLPQGQQWKCNPALGDVNGDGLLDLAAISRKGKGARVWINQDNGVWTDASEGLSMKDSCGGGVKFGDINHDGHSDLAVADHCGGIFVYTGDGSGRWTPLAASGLATMPADDLALADFNGDGNLDLAACSATNQGIGLFWGDGKGSWNKATDSGLPAQGICHEIAPGDFNHDGRLDLVASMLSKPHLFFSTGKGKWEEPSEEMAELPWEGKCWGVAVGDVNGDGHLDLALAQIVKGAQVFLGDGRGGWQPALNGLSVVQSAWGIALKDLDGDGHTDLVVSGKKDLHDRGNAYGVFLFRGDGTGNWTLIERTGLPREGLYQSWGVALDDLEGDGEIEIAGCFGISHTEEIPFLSIQPGKKEGVLKEREWGPGGCVKVWKVR